MQDKAPTCRGDMGIPFQCVKFFLSDEHRTPSDTCFLSRILRILKAYVTYINDSVDANDEGVGIKREKSILSIGPHSLQRNCFLSDIITFRLRKPNSLTRESFFLQG